MMPVALPPPILRPAGKGWCPATPPRQPIDPWRRRGGRCSEDFVTATCRSVCWDGWDGWMWWLWLWLFASFAIVIRLEGFCHRGALAASGAGQAGQGCVVLPACRCCCRCRCLVVCQLAGLLTAYQAGRPLRASMLAWRCDGADNSAGGLHGCPSAHP